MSDDTKLILAILDKRFDRIDEHLDGLDERLDGLDERLDGLEGRMDGFDGRMDGLEGRMDRLEGQMDKLEGRMDGLEEGVTHLRLVIENEIRPHIQMLAEGHVMLNEKIDRALGKENEREELITRVDALETGFQLMQDKINKTA